MVRLKTLLVSCACLLSAAGIAQEKERDWKINAAFSFAPGLLTENTQTIQLHGYLGFLQQRIQIRGDMFYYLGAFGDRPRFDMNHQIYTGAFYHFSDKQFQPYVGFQPGIAIARSSEYQTLVPGSTTQLESRVATNPIGAAAGGFSYFGEKLFFLFFETRYIFGKHKTNAYPVFLDELRFSFGLGFTF
jgi:hypothetical protein